MRRLPHIKFDLTAQTDALGDACTPDPSSGSTFWPQQLGAAPRLGLGMVPPSRPVRADDQMSVQETQKSRTSVPHFSASESAPPDVGVLRLNLPAHHSQCPRVASRPSAMHIH